MSSADLRTTARIRTAAIDLFGQRGIRATTIRDVAEAASVSPALVMHHFGSKDGLRAACDEWVLAQITSEKTTALRDASGYTSDAFARVAQFTGLAGYVAASLSEGGPGADRLFDQLCTVTADLFDSSALAMKPVQDRQAMIATIVVYSCGAALLGDQLARHLGGTSLYDPAVYPRYALAALEMFTHGVLAEDSLLGELRESVAAALIADPDPPPADPSGATHAPPSSAT